MPLRAVPSSCFLSVTPLCFPVLQGEPLLSTTPSHSGICTSVHLLEAIELLSWIEISESVSLDKPFPFCFGQVPCHSNDRKEKWLNRSDRYLAFGFSKSASSDIVFPAWPSLLNLPKQDQQLGTRYSNA